MIKIKEPLHQPAKTALSSVVCVCMCVCVSTLPISTTKKKKKNTESEKGGSATPKEMHFFKRTFTV